MAKSQSESPLRLAFSLVSLRGAEGDVAISRSAEGKRTVPGPGRNTVLKVVRGFSLAREHKMGSLK